MATQSAIRAVKGMNDILPSSVARWHRFERTFRETVERYGFGEVRTPSVEFTQLFVRSIGEVTDVVEKEMYTFADEGGSLTLRPEGTAGVVRAFLESGTVGREPWSKWYYMGPMFRRERPQRGRYRQFHQAGVEVFGDEGPYVDAEVIEMAVHFLQTLGVIDVEVVLNSLGSGNTRERYREALVSYLTPFADSLSAESQRRLLTNPLRVLDSKSEKDREICINAPQLHEFLSPEDTSHFEGVCSTLSRLGVAYRVDQKLVRGLDYYSRTLFEIVGRGGDLGAQNTLCGGGRYDGLIKTLGGPELSSIGLAFGIERVLLSMPEAEEVSSIDVFVVAADEVGRKEATVLLRDLRRAGFRAEADLRGQAMKKQLARADKSGADFALVVGETEVNAGIVQAKKLKEHLSENVARGELVARLMAWRNNS